MSVGSSGVHRRSSGPTAMAPESVVEKDDSDLIATGKLLLRYKDERWYSESFVITYWQIEIISFAKKYL